MKTPSELFALNEWLADFPDDMTYDEIIEVMREDKNEWIIDRIDVWEVVEHFTLDQVADFIEMTKKHFERVVAQILEEAKQ
jgi:hypothetical protein